MHYFQLKKVFQNTLILTKQSFTLMISIRNSWGNFIFESFKNCGYDSHILANLTALHAYDMYSNSYQINYFVPAFESVIPKYKKEVSNNEWFRYSYDQNSIVKFITSNEIFVLNILDFIWVDSDI